MLVLSGVLWRIMNSERICVYMFLQQSCSIVLVVVSKEQVTLATLVLHQTTQKNRFEDLLREFIKRPNYKWEELPDKAMGTRVAQVMKNMRKSWEASMEPLWRKTWECKCRLL